MAVATWILLASVLTSPSIHSSESDGRVTIHCQLDTELALDQLRLTVREKRELEVVPDGDGWATLPDLPEGDLHLVFYRNEDRLDEIEISSTEAGDFVRLKIRLVEGNAIALDEFRVRGVSAVEGASEPSTAMPARSATAERTSSVRAVPGPGSGPVSSPDSCPAVGKTISKVGTIRERIDNDSLELSVSDRTGEMTYVVYIGSATRLRDGTRVLRRRDLREGDRIWVRGDIAAGPQDECSVGAKEIVVRN